MININADELKEKLDSGENILIIDVRNPQEITRGRIPKSINIPLDNFENEVEKEIKNKNDQVCVYCLSGSRSEIACEILEDLGYTNVLNLSSGMLAWRNGNYPQE